MRNRAIELIETPPQTRKRSRALAWFQSTPTLAALVSRFHQLWSWHQPVLHRRRPEQGAKKKGMDPCSGVHGQVNLDHSSNSILKRRAFAGFCRPIYGFGSFDWIAYQYVLFISPSSPAAGPGALSGTTTTLRPGLEGTNGSNMFPLSKKAMGKTTCHYLQGCASQVTTLFLVSGHFWSKKSSPGAT